MKELKQFYVYLGQPLKYDAEENMQVGEYVHNPLFIYLMCM